MFKRLAPIAAGAFGGYLLYSILGAAMYTSALTEFYEYEYSFAEHGIVINGYASKATIGRLISISDLEAKEPGVGGSTVKQVCEDVESARGHTTLSFVGEAAVCCWADESQRLIPYKDVGDTRHYLCGNWPQLDHVTQLIEKTKLGN